MNKFEILATDLEFAGYVSASRKTRELARYLLMENEIPQVLVDEGENVGRRRGHPSVPLDRNRIVLDGQKVREIRKQRGITLTNMGVGSAPYMSGLERNKFRTGIPLSRAEQIAQKLGVDIKDITLNNP